MSFLELYASAPRGDALAELTASPELREWARWIGIQNELRGGTLEGRLDLERVNFIGEQGDAVVFGLDAVAEFDYTPEGGETTELRYLFLGPAAVAPSDGGWGVVDITRDGTSLASTVSIIDSTGTSELGVSVSMSSVFRSQSSTFANMVIRNGAAQPLELLDRPTLYVADVPIPANNATYEPPMTVEPGEEVAVSAGFPTPTPAAPEAVLVRIRVGDTRATLTFSFPAGSFPPPQGPSGPDPQSSPNAS